MPRDNKTVTREDIGSKEMVPCKPMKTYVPLAFCLNGGPMNAKGRCEWFIEFKTYPPDKPGGDPIKEVVHAYPTSERVERHVTMTSPAGKVVSLKNKKNG